MPKTPDVLKPPRLACHYLREPLLLFGDGGRHVDPKSGIARYGPRSLSSDRHPSEIRVGLIGTAQTIEVAQQWLETSAQGVPGNEDHPEFPGYQRDRGFFSSLKFSTDLSEQVTQTELREHLAIRSRRERFEALLAMLEDKLRLVSEKDHPPQYVVLGLPDDLYAKSATIDYRDASLGSVHRDFRRALKALAMKYRVPTQVLRQRTMEGRDPDLPSKIAWNYFTGLYFKAGGVPWSPTGLQPGTCFVGVGFYRPLGSENHCLQTSLVQAFDDHGEGLVLRGHDFEWDPEREGTRAPHLTAAAASDLISMVLARYESEMKQPPRRVVVHKTSRYWKDERAGFVEALTKRVGHFDLVALEREHEVRLLPENTYPPLRGTRFSVGEFDYLYTNGFISELQEFHGLHVPLPIRISDHVGQDTPRDQLLREVLTLTKMNWNSSRLGGFFPITLRFSSKVAEILREVPPDREPLPQFKYYV